MFLQFDPMKIVTKENNPVFIQLKEAMTYYVTPELSTDEQYKHYCP